MALQEVNRWLEKLQKLLAKEKAEDLLQYKDALSSTSFVERRKKGVCWYPIDVVEAKFDAGERLLVTVQRAKEHTNNHSFQSGKLVSFFSNSGNGDDEFEVTGVVNFVKEDKMTLTLNADEMPDWLHRGNMGVQLLFDENSYKEMEFALNKVITSEEDDIIRLKQTLLGDRKAQFKDTYPLSLPKLNEVQNKALNLVASAEDVAIIHGPPGTGKTTTLVQSILYTLKHEKQVLVCAPSNAAVDLLAEKLSSEGVDVIRIGHPARVTEEVMSSTLDACIAKHNDFKILKTIHKQAEECRKQAGKYKRNFGAEERAQRRELYTEARKLKKEAQQLEFHITSDLLNRAQVICSTMVGASNIALRGRKFSTVFIDEAAQGLEPASWIPILKAHRVMFAGDHCQLPPTIKSHEAAKEGMEVTLFEKAIKNNSADVMLTEQYRMNDIIMGFSSRIFYKNALKANTLVSEWLVFNEDLPLEFIDTAGCGFYEQVNEETKSSFNEEEADLCIKHMTQYAEMLSSFDKQCIHFESIAVVSPYKSQTVLIKNLIGKNSPFADDFVDKISVNTIDSFQGQERDVVYISLVRSNDNGKIGFLSDIRRMNVAMTRARKKLVVIGDSATICQNSFYSDFVDYANEVGAYRSAFEFMY